MGRFRIKYIIYQAERFEMFYINPINIRHILRLIKTDGFDVLAMSRIGNHFVGTRYPRSESCRRTAVYFGPKLCIRATSRYNRTLCFQETRLILTPGRSITTIIATRARGGGGISRGWITVRSNVISAKNVGGTLRIRSGRAEKSEGEIKVFVGRQTVFFSK